MTAEKHSHRGFSFVELIAVISILSILATLAAIVYSRFALDRYDSEAMATLHSLNEQAFVLMSEWGVGGKGVGAQCYSLNPGAGKDGSATNVLGTDAASLGVKMEGVQHWYYQICFGVDSNSTEIYIASAHRIVPTGNQRVIVAGSGFAEPVVAFTGEEAINESLFKTPSTVAIKAWKADKSTEINK